MNDFLIFDSPIHNLQVFLRTISAHYSDIPNVIPDGVYGEATEKSVRAFQKKYNLNETGVTDYETWDAISALYNDIVIKQTPRKLNVYPEEELNALNTSYSPTIMIIQSMFVSLANEFSNIQKLEVTGEFDDATKSAVESFRYAGGLEPRNSIDIEFWNHLTALYEAHISVNRYRNSVNRNITDG